MSVYPKLTDQKGDFVQIYLGEFTGLLGEQRRVTYRSMHDLQTAASPGGPTLHG